MCDEIRTEILDRKERAMQTRTKHAKYGLLTPALLIIVLTCFIGQSSLVAAAGTPPAIIGTPSPFTLPANLKMNMAGYQATGPVHTFQKGQMNFTVPAFTQPNTYLVTRLNLEGNPQTSPSVNVSTGITSNTNATGVQSNSAWWMTGTTEKDITFALGIHAKDIISLSLTSNSKNNTNTVVITNTTTKESHQDQLTGPQYITAGSMGKCVLYRPTIAIPDPKTGQPSQEEELAALPDFGTETFSNCSFSNGVAPLSTVTKLAMVLKLDMITQIALPTAQDPKHLIMTIGTAITPNATGQSFVIKQISKQQLLNFP
jgi:hypothetical protein